MMINAVVSPSFFVRLAAAAQIQATASARGLRGSTRPQMTAPTANAAHTRSV